MPNSKYKPSSTLNEIDSISYIVIGEQNAAKLPGKEKGPSDAFRHLLLSAELTRRLGANTADAILFAHEIDGDIRNGQSLKERQMDIHNNRIGMKIGATAQSWGDVVDRCRAVMASSIIKGKDDPKPNSQLPNQTLKFVTWLDKSEWVNSKEVASTNWPNPTFKHSHAEILEKRLTTSIVVSDGTETGTYHRQGKGVWIFEDKIIEETYQIKNPKKIKELEDYSHHITQNQTPSAIPITPQQANALQPEKPPLLVHAESLLAQTTQAVEKRYKADNCGLECGSKNVSMVITAEALARGMDSIDQVVLIKGGKPQDHRFYAIQGNDIDTGISIKVLESQQKPVSESLAKINSIIEERVLAASDPSHQATQKDQGQDLTPERKARSI